MCSETLQSHYFLYLMKIAFVSRNVSCLIVSQEFCILLFCFCFFWFLSRSVGQNAAWIKLKSELLYGVHSLWFTSVCTVFILTEKKFQLFAIKKFQLSPLFGINWRPLNQWACWNFCMYIIREQITLLRANQIARIAIDFKVDETNRKTSKYQTECQCSVIHNNVQENKNNLKCIIVYIFVIVGRKWLLLWMSLLHHFNNYNTGNGV